MKYAVPISFVFANELSDRRIANARKLAGKFDTLSLSVSLIDWIFKIKGGGKRKNESLTHSFNFRRTNFPLKLSQFGLFFF